MRPLPRSTTVRPAARRGPREGRGHGPTQPAAQEHSWRFARPRPPRADARSAALFLFLSLFTVPESSVRYIIMLNWPDVLNLAKTGTPAPDRKVIKTDAEWRKQLGPEELSRNPPGWYRASLQFADVRAV